MKNKQTKMFIKVENELRIKNNVNKIYPLI